MNKITSAIMLVVAMSITVPVMATPNGGDVGEDGGAVGVGIGVGIGVGGEATSSAESLAAAAASSESSAIAAQKQSQSLDNTVRVVTDASSSNVNEVAGGSSTVKNDNVVKNGSASESSAYNAGNTMIIGGTVFTPGEGGEGVDTQSTGGSSSVLSPSAVATNGDQTNTQTVGDTTQTQTVGDTNVTVVNEGLSQEAARELGQPDIVEVDARSTDTDNSQIDASTTINNNNKYKQAVATSAPVFSSVCTSGASTQTRSLGIGLAVTSSVCEHLMMADAFNAMGNGEMVNQHLTKASKLANFRGGLSRFRSLITVGIL